MNILSQVKETVSTLISLSEREELIKYIQIAEEEISHLLLGDLPNERIATIFNIFVFSPLQQRITKLEEELPPASRSTIKTRENSLLLIELLDFFRLKLLNHYSPIINTSIYHQRQIENEIARKESERDFLINPSEYNDNVSIYELSPQHCKRILEEAYSNTLLYFNRALKNTNGKLEAYTFITKGKAEIIILQSKIDQLKNELLDLESKKENYTGIVKNDEGITDLNYVYLEKWIYKSDIIENYILHEQFLANILKHLQEISFIFIEDVTQSLPKTVFGNRNYEVLHKLFDTIKPFMHPETKLQEFIDAFTISENFINPKIRFANVKLDNYADLITKTHPYFIDSIGNKKTYNQWWADRFTFNGSEKSKDAISTMRSNTLKDANRKPDHPTIIKEIVDILDENLQ